MESQVILQAAGITKKFDQITIAHDIDLSIKEGEILAIMGKSGVGKSTLLRILAGLEGFQAGKIVFDGVALEKAEDTLVPGHEELQYVAQDFRLLKNRTVLENIKEALLAFKDSFTAQKVEFLLSTLHLAHLQNKRIELLSGGEKQRLAIARAMASEPSILLLDEPFTQLDQINRQHLIDALLAIRESLNTTIIMVTHQAEEVFLLADRAGVLSGGALVQLGSPRELYESPSNLEVANLFGPINLLSQELITFYQLNINSASQFGIRPEDIHITDKENRKGIRGEVKKCTYMGNYSGLIIDSKFQNELLIFHSSGKFKVGDELFFQLNVDHTIKWKVR